MPHCLLDHALVPGTLEFPSLFLELVWASSPGLHTRGRNLADMSIASA